MSRSLFGYLVLGVAIAAAGQQGSNGSSNSSQPQSQPAPSSPSGDSSANSSSRPAQDSTPQPSKKPAAPNLAPPRSDRVDAGALSEEIGESSSKDTQIDSSPPENDTRAHPNSAAALTDVPGDATAGSGVGEFHIWDPHKAAKSVEVGDFYFKRKNYRAAEERYREALRYKDNDAVATFRLAVCLEKMDRPEDAITEYDSYLKILPHGPQADEALKSIDRLKPHAAKAAQINSK